MEMPHIANEALQVTEKDGLSNKWCWDNLSEKKKNMIVYLPQIRHKTQLQT